jgi:hypothetical protein
MTSICARGRLAATLVLVAAATAFLAAQGQWKELFNGKDFSGWTAAGGGGRAGAPAPATPPSTNPAERSWKVENGVMTSVPTAESKQSSAGLNTTDKFLDFELELDYKLDEAPNTDCTPKLGPKPGRNGQTDPQANLSKDGACTFNSGISFRSGYQLNLGRREAGEYVGVVVHRQLPEAIRGNVDWISTGDCGAKNHTYLQDCSQFPEIRKKGDWNHVRIMFKGDHLQVWLNNKQITDVNDKPMTDKFPAESAWGEAQPINLQFPPAGEGGGFPGKVQYKNIRIRTL